MKLVIPMSGHGSRFEAVGYKDLKPLINVEGKPIIAHVLDAFPGEEDVIFICNEDHLADTSLHLHDILLGLKPQATIVAAKNIKHGPVYATSAAFPHIPDDEEVIVSYCDFSQLWDYERFKHDVATKKPAGAIPSYTGFHPHLLHKNLYAGILTDSDNWLTAIKEKYCFTENPEDSYHSSGVYYFSSGKILKQYSQELMSTNMGINGEFYTSMLYYLLHRDNLPIYIPTITYFKQWGTPQDLEEYEAWSQKIHTDLGREKKPTAIPECRRNQVSIQYTEDSAEYQKCYSYWYNCLK